ncbi:unnamed protein product [Sphenostylis stenocarpa]|uniref:Histone deacetylase complex subunit SAP30 Sin3 binding domain-containing protein n=1 Tax=Sphenostylis stenocarpa TaxID=92480 RepID=A0AA86VT22_9FABA|nr:unnamed protein product [Sphenostylis stenocarpa]
MEAEAEAEAEASVSHKQITPTKSYRCSRILSIILCANGVEKRFSSLFFSTFHIVGPRSTALVAPLWRERWRDRKERESSELEFPVLEWIGQHRRQFRLFSAELEMLEAMESSVNGGFSHLQSCGDSSEEELSVLPRHTKVVVTGNNRTKSVLVGLQGVVKKAVGLGGWHWLVLTNGIEVKLQRNALSVIEAPTGNEEDDDLEFENMQWNGSDMASDDTQKSHKSRHRMHRTLGSSHKTMSRSFSGDSHSKGSVSMPHGSAKVDLSKLEMAALWRYWRHFNLVDAVPNPSKEQLVDVVQRHFMSQQIDELQVIMGFVQAAKRLKTVCK